MTKQLTLEDQSGKRIARIGKAGIQRALMVPVNVTEKGKKDYAMVRCVEKDIYISRDGQRACTFNVTWFDADESEQSRDFAESNKAIAFFLKLVKELYE